MKSHSDVASRSSAEVVTQLPVPSRLGLLRFERLNEANWTLLFLDPACERSIGVPAADLCSLLDAPFASLMEPQSRYLLHDEIQEQLRQHMAYQVRYSLHTPHGKLVILETGEMTRQRGRELLHGYLMPLDMSVSDPTLTEEMLGELHRHGDHAARVRAMAQQHAIVQIARHRYQDDDIVNEAANLIIRTACETLQVDRASLWRLPPDSSMLACVAAYSHSQGHERVLAPVDLTRYPDYLQALQSGRAIDAHEARHDPRTRSLYLDAPGQLNSVRSLLDAPIRVEGEVVGVLCLEQTSQPRTWQSDEVVFAAELADQFAQVLAHQERRHISGTLQLFRRAVEQSGSAFLLIDRDGRIEYVNPSFSAITQYSAEEVHGRNLRDLPELEDLSNLLSDANSVLSQQPSVTCEFRCRRKDDEPYWGQFSLSRVHGDDGGLTHFIGIFDDVTEAKLARQHIEQLAYHDNLTGLSNRHYFISVLEQQLADVSTPSTLLLVDVDNFKRINDSLGHQIGDKVLVNLARRLRNALPDAVALARIASNEFAVLLADTELHAGQALAIELLAGLDKPLFVDNQAINISSSIGLACAPQHGQDPQLLIKHAGLALHKSKAGGRHQVQVFTEALTAEASYKLFLENNLRHALDQQELAVHYQPKLCLRSGRLLGLEALLRWNHPEKGMIRPDQFISVAEETGLILPIGKWVIREACRLSQQLKAAGLGDLRIAINLSPKQFLESDLVTSIREILSEEAVSAPALELELTEGLLLEATYSTRQQLSELKKLGFTLAMDDFGTGYSSLSYLKKFPIDVIKIDRSFIKDIPDSQDDMEITSAVIAMAHNLKLEVVAEGIETPAQLAFLRKHRCDVGQGYLFDRPIASEALFASLGRYQRQR